MAAECEKWKTDNGNVTYNHTQKLNQSQICFTELILLGLLFSAFPSWLDIFACSHLNLMYGHKLMLVVKNGDTQINTQV